MSVLIALFARLGLGERVSKVLGWVSTGLIVFALLWALWAFWLHRHDAGVVEQHEQGVAFAVVSATAAAEDVANANDLVRASERAAADQQLRDAIDDVQTAQPAAVRAPAGPAVNAVADRLRRQRAAAARNP